MQATDDLDTPQLAGRRRRSRLIVACVVIFGTMVVLGRVLPTIFEMLH